MAIWLKEGKSESEIIEADEKVKRTVESILNDVSKRGDEAVRELSLNSHRIAGKTKKTTDF